MKTTLFLILIFVFSSISYAGGLPKSAVVKIAKIRTVAIDPGFGGSELGPIGCNNAVKAKEINLKIAKMVAQKIEHDLGIKAILTRDSDKTICLLDRLNVAYLHKASLLVSIHTNAANNPSVSGIETYSLHIGPDPKEFKKATTQNKINSSQSKLDSILQDLMQNARINESERLAHNVQNSIYNNVITIRPKVVNRGVKAAPFYMLLNYSMPAILVETGFITSSTECEYLRSAEYQEAISNGIVDGIRAYINKK